MNKKVDLKLMPTGLSTFDKIVLEGGLPHCSLNVICGPPGSGKTIFSYQTLMANVSRENKAICFTTISEPPIKVLRYLQQFDFFDADRFSEHIKLIDLGMIIRKASYASRMEEVIGFIREEIEKQGTSLVVIDSFKAIASLIGGEDSMRKFTYDLGTELVAFQCISFLVGEYTKEEIISDSVFAIADGIILLSADRKGYLRRNYIEVLKMRGTGYFAGKHRFLIDSSGIAVYPRLKPKELPVPKKAEKKKRIKTGIPGLDKMTAGGFYLGSTTLLAGVSGVGKTILSLQFLVEGAKIGSKGLFVSFEESPEKLFYLAATCGMGLDQLVAEKKVILYHISPVELSVDKFHYQLISLIEKERPERVVIDSIADISVTIADPTNLKNYLLSLVSRFSELGVTSILTSEMREGFTVTSTRLSVVIDTIISLKYKKEGEKVNRVVSVVKMRGSDHDKGIKKFEVTSKGIVIQGVI